MNATAKGKNLPISTKQSVEICRTIRGKSTKNALALLERVVEQKSAIPYKRYNKDTPHRKGDGIAAGRYPINSCTHIIRLIKEAVANAANKGLNTDKLLIAVINAERAISKERNKRYQQGRATNINLILEEVQL